MPPTTPSKPQVFIDADVLFAGAASPGEHSASQVILRMAEITLIKAFASQQVITEAERNLKAKLPIVLPAFHLIVSRCLSVVPTPPASELRPFKGLADAKDLSILVAAIQSNCTWLVTFHIRHFQPGHPDVTVLRPGEFLSRIRDLLTYL